MCITNAQYDSKAFAAKFVDVNMPTVSFILQTRAFSNKVILFIFKTRALKMGVKFASEFTLSFEDFYLISNSVTQKAGNEKRRRIQG